MSKSLEGRWFPWMLGLSVLAHGAIPFLPGSDISKRPDFKVEERMAAIPMTVRLIQPDPVPVPQPLATAPLPVLTSDQGVRTVQSIDVEPVEFERERDPEPQLPPPLEPPPAEPLPEPEPAPLIQPVDLPPPPPAEEPPPEPEPEPRIEPTPPPLRDVPLPTGPIEQESQSGVVSRAAPKGRGNRAPLYPRRARATKMEGTTELEVMVRADGTVERLVVHKSSGHLLLDDEAMKAVKRWKFTPAKGSSGKPAMDRVIVPVTFRLTKK